MTMVKNMKNVTESISAGEFKAKCLKLMDDVNIHHKSIVITKHGKPIARLVPIDEEPVSLFGAMKGSMKIKDDIIAPTGEAWDAENDS